MNRPAFRPQMETDFDNLLGALTTQQHLRPHESVQQSLAHTVADLSVCPSAIEQALTWLGLDPSKSIGRLRRTELMQLARTVHRYWRQTSPAAAAAPRQP